MSTVQMVPIAKIRVLNSRARSKAKFQEIVANIEKVGLKKPITVSRRREGDDGFDLVCGQGRLEAYVALGQTEVPAIVVEVPLEERYVMSLVENLARRPRTTIEMAREFIVLKERGHSHGEIAAKVGLSDTYVAHLIRLLQNGEERLVDAVERGDVPLAVAIEITASSDETVQRSLQDAYESGELRGKAIQKVRRVVELRRLNGKGMSNSRSGRRRSGLSAQDLLRTYKKETHRQELLVKKAHHTERQLRFIASALKDLFRDEDFVNLVRSEALAELPKYLAESMEKR
jgi:ParB family chromosome partitioning protein